MSSCRSLYYLNCQECKYECQDLKQVNIGIKHVFSCINIRQVPREVLKTEAGSRGFQHLRRDLANFNAIKKLCFPLGTWWMLMRMFMRM